MIGKDRTDVIRLCKCQWLISCSIINILMQDKPFREIQSFVKQGGYKILPSAGTRFDTGYWDVKKAVNQKGVLFTAKVIEKNIVKQLDLEANLCFTNQILAIRPHLVFSQNFLRSQKFQTDQAIVMIAAPYQYNLHQYLRRFQLDEKHVLQIYDKILKVVYSVYLAGVICGGLKTSQFVFSDGQWKVQSLILNRKHKEGVSCEYLIDQLSQPPQFEIKAQIISPEERKAMLVWNLGVVLLELLLGGRAISCYGDSCYRKGHYHMIERQLAELQPFSQPLQEAVRSMLRYDRRQRMLLVDVFQDSLLSPEVSAHFLMTKQKKEGNSETKQLIKTQDSETTDKKQKLNTNKQGIQLVTSLQEIKSGLNKKEIESDVDEEEKVIESLMNEDDGLKSSMEEEEDKKSEIKNKNEGSSSLIRPPSEDRRYSIIPNITSTSDYCIHCYSEFYEELELKEQCINNISLPRSRHQQEPLILYEDKYKDRCHVCGVNPSNMINTACRHMLICQSCLLQRVQDGQAQQCCPRGKTIAMTCIRQSCLLSGFYIMNLQPLY